MNMFRKVFAMLLCGIAGMSSSFATTGVLYSSGGGGKPTVGFFRTIDTSDPLFSLIFLMFLALMTGYFVWEFIKWMFSGVKGGISSVSGAVRESKPYRGAMLRSHDFTSGQICRKCGCTKDAAENFGWRCQERANAVTPQRNREKSAKPSVYASRRKYDASYRNVVNTLPARQKSNRG